MKPGSSHATNRFVIPLAIALDLLLGDPPNRLHPVAWMGSLIAFLRNRRPHNHPLAELAYGAGIVLGGATLAAGIGWSVHRLLSRLPPGLRLLAEALALKTTFSLRGLDRAAGQVQTALEQGDLPQARRLLSWHLVSRDTRQLDEAQIAAAAIESVAENASDGVVAPLLFDCLGGLPAALAYRYLNTADAMLGYHTPDLEWLGKVPARLDDLANLIPARLTGALNILASPLAGGSLAGAWRALQRDARLTESPNAGYPMSAMAGALGVELEKTGHYRLGRGNRRPNHTDLARSRRLLYGIAALAGILFSLAAVCSRTRQ